MYKWTNRLHVFICPKLMITVWGRLLFKMADLVVYGPLGEIFWSSSMHKYFFLGFVYPLISHGTWRLKGTTKVMGLGRTVSFLIHESAGNAGSDMRQIRLLLKRLAFMPGVLEQVLLIS